DILSLHYTPVATVIAVVSIVAHHEVTVSRNLLRTKIIAHNVIVWNSGAPFIDIRVNEIFIGFFEHFPVDKDHLVFYFQSFIWQSYHSLDEGNLGILRRFESNDVAASNVPCRQNPG